MVKEDRGKLLNLLSDYYNELVKDCKFDCYNCELGVLRGYGESFSCALDVVIENL